ncbi:MAG: glycosyltransferase, partial [Rothia sp. (in: high G+C Gram-positive bacteria)]|nr:glycosyltransferase [Rothia sp. (in: high G+C Gram-positive bacteria)]
IPVSNGIELSDYEQQESEVIEKDPGEMRIFFAGRLALEKNIDVLIEALSKLPSRLGHVVLEIAGTGEHLETLQKKAAECGVESRVRFLGFVSDEELREGYLRANVFCQPGTAELQSLVTLEAMSASRPVVLANALALPHLVEEGVNGYLFEPGNSSDLAEKLALILELPKPERKAMGAMSHEMAQKHAAKKTWDTFESLYTSSKIYYDFVTQQRQSSEGENLGSVV